MSRTPEPVVVIVRIPTPRLAPGWLVRRKMRATIDTYAHIPGLAFKIFTIEMASGDFGGIYYWTDRGAAESWFDEAWFERVRRERGSEPNVRILRAPLSIDNVAGGTPFSTDRRRVATLVEIPIPQGVTDDLLHAGFAAAQAEYREVPGLLRKYFIINGDKGTFGGVYLWDRQASANAWFDAAWVSRVKERYGNPAVIENFTAPIVLPTRQL